MGEAKRKAAQGVLRPQRLRVVIPTYHQVSTMFLASLLNMMSECPQVTGKIDVSEGVYAPDAAKILVESALKHDDWDRLVFLECDMLCPQDALAYIAMHHREDIVGSLYFRHRPPFAPVVLMTDQDGLYNPITKEMIKDWTDNPGLYEVICPGLGLTSIARRVIENWKSELPMFHKEGRLASHDVWFCHYAREQGFKVYVDTAIRCAHETMLGIHMLHNQNPELGAKFASVGAHL